jgi:hypothetical protein
MLERRVPWWMYLVAAIYILTIGFNARQEFWGPASTGWAPSWPATRVVGVTPGRPMERAGLQAGDVLIAANRQPLTGMPDWFVVPAHFEVHQPIDLRIQRGGQARGAPRPPCCPDAGTRCCRGRISLFRLGGRASSLARRARDSHLSGHRLLPAGIDDMAGLLCRFRPAVAFATLATGSGAHAGANLGSPDRMLNNRLDLLSRDVGKPWPQVFSAAPVGLIQDTAGVAPLLFFAALPGYRPGIQVGLLDVWLGLTILNFLAGALILAAAWLRTEHPHERRRLGALCFAVVVFGAVVAHNVFERNWVSWFGTPLPILLSKPVSVIVEFLFLHSLLVLIHCSAVPRLS